MKKSSGYDALTFDRGLICDVYRLASGYDCTNKGVTSEVEEVLLVGPGVNGPFEAKNSVHVVLYLHYWDMNDGTRSYFASPDPSNGMRYMFGGNFIYTSDSRLPGGNAIKVHDRRE